MSNSRLLVVSGAALGTEVPLFTYQKDDRTAQGVWSKPNAPLIIFADNTLDGTTFSYHGGAVAGAPDGHPVQLVFWGSWWAGPGAPARAFLEGSTRAMLYSPYFDQLGQYGIARPVWRGSVTVTEPAPPVSVSDLRTIGRQMVSLIDDLIDDDVFPDPDDGPRILFVVLLPDGFTLLSDDALGAHRWGYDYDFPFDEPDEDRFWAGWVGPQADRQIMMWVLSHEIVEMLTDPESDAWHTENNTVTNEISDAGFSGGTPAKPDTPQTAIVNGVRVQSYWSNAHNATVIPVDQDYGAQLRVRVKELARRTIADGTFGIDAADRVGCPDYPECCIEDREYAWRVYGLDERARVTLDCRRYVTPIAAWSINGIPLTGPSPVTLNVDVEEFVGRTATTTNRPVIIRFDAQTDRLDVFADNPGGNFDIIVSCSVRDGSITGNVATNIVATPSIVVGFACSELLLEDSYIRQKSACLAAMVKRYVQHYKPLGRLRPEEGINWNPSEILRDVPAHIGPNHYARLRWLADVGRAANAMLGPREAARFTRALISDALVLARNIQVPSKEERRRQRSISIVNDPCTTPAADPENDETQI